MHQNMKKAILDLESNPLSLELELYIYIYNYKDSTLEDYTEFKLTFEIKFSFCF